MPCITAAFAAAALALNNATGDSPDIRICKPAEHAMHDQRAVDHDQVVGCVFAMQIALAANMVPPQCGANTM